MARAFDWTFAVIYAGGQHLFAKGVTPLASSTGIVPGSDFVASTLSLFSSNLWPVTEVFGERRTRHVADLVGKTGQTGVLMASLNPFATTTTPQALHPQLPIVIATGYDSAELARRFAADPKIAFVRKPCTQVDLKAVASRLLPVQIAPLSSSRRVRYKGTGRDGKGQPRCGGLARC